MSLNESIARQVALVRGDKVPPLKPMPMTHDEVVREMARTGLNWTSAVVTATITPGFHHGQLSVLDAYAHASSHKWSADA